ncbi:outer membrane lipase/esterase [Oxalobacteraceae bacterium GrIS 2.11]
MLQNKFSLVIAAAVTAAFVAGCGGSGTSAGNQAPKVQFSSQVSFGDSLSDVGSYEVGLIAHAGGGRFTVNTFTSAGAHLPTNYTEILAAQLRLPDPCPAQTGLVGNPGSPLIVAVVNNPGCMGYGQGGARVTNPVGIGNPLIPPNNGFAMTVPVATQITNHLQAHGGKFSGTELVLVLAGANDVFFNFGGVAQGETPAQAVGAVTQAATELASYVNNQIIGNGANYVVVMNIPDVSTTPFGNASEASAPGSKALLAQMVTAFNSTLQAALTSPKVLYVDLFTVSDQQISDPAAFGLTNVTTPACNLNSPNNILANPAIPNSGSSLVCNETNLIPGDVSYYEFADSVHPTPYGNILLAKFVAKQMLVKGWL